MDRPLSSVKKTDVFIINILKKIIAIDMTTIIIARNKKAQKKVFNDS